MSIEKWISEREPEEIRKKKEELFIRAYLTFLEENL